MLSTYQMLEQIHMDFFPQLRIGQAMMNFCAWHENKYHNDIFYVEDTELMYRFLEFAHEVTSMDKNN